MNNWIKLIWIDIIGLVLGPKKKAAILSKEIRIKASIDPTGSFQTQDDKGDSLQCRQTVGHIRAIDAIQGLSSQSTKKIKKP